MKALYAWVDEDGGGLQLVFPREAAERIEQVRRLMNVGHMCAAALAMTFKDAHPETSPEFRAVGQAADGLARAILDFHECARKELAKAGATPVPTGDPQ